MGYGMLSSKGTNNDNIRPFQLVKFFTYSSLAVILFCTLVLFWIISQRAKVVLLERSEAYAYLLAENLNHQVFQQFVIPTVIRYRNIALSNPKQFELLDTIVQNVTHGLKIDSVTIFDAKENIISYSTIPEIVGKRDVGGNHYQKALVGQNDSFLVLNGGVLNLLPGQEKITGKLKTYIPFRREGPLSQNTGSIMGVIEIVQDLSDDFEAIIRFRVTIIGVSVLIMAILFAVLRFIVSRADHIMEERALEKQRLKEELHQAERLASLGKMVASVSHEIKNPLGIIRSTAEMLGKRLAKVAPDNGRLAEIITAETARLDGIVREFLDFARPQTPRLFPCDINQILTKGLHFMEAEFERNNITTKINLAESLGEIMADENLLYRAFLNIMVNALQAMPNGGKLTITTHRRRGSNGDVVIEISDTGIGIAASKLDLIFTPFFTEKHRGTGLGLAIVKNIIDAHQGDVQAVSEEGKGTTIKMVLPG